MFGLFGFAQLAHNFRRRSQNQTFWRHNRTLGNQSARTNQRAFAYHRLVQHNRAHANQAAIFNRASMKNRPVSDDNITSDDAGIVIADMKHRMILNIAAPPDPNRGNISANDRAEPYADVIAQLAVSNHAGEWSDIDVLAQLRRS